MAQQFSFLPKGRGVLSLWDIPEGLIGTLDKRRPLDRICELMRKHNTQSVVIQYQVHKEPYFKKIYSHLGIYLRDIHNTADLLNVIQIVFLSCPITSINKKQFPKGLKSKDILGVGVIVSLQFKKSIARVHRGETVSFVYEAILRFPGADAERKESSSLPNNYYHVFSNVRFWIAGKEFSLPSSYFCQTDGVEAVCSQASLRMAIFHCEPPSTDVPSYRAMNKIVRHARRQIPSLSRRAFNPFDGYYILDIQAFLKSQGIYPFILDCEKNPSISPYEWAYLLVESGIPTLIVFSPSLNQAKVAVNSHVIPIVGHTTNYDEWLPPAYSFYENFEGFPLFNKGKSYVSSASWASHLIVQDDLLGPYHCLGERDLITISKRGKAVSLKSRIQYVIGLVPKSAGFTISPYTAQDMGGYCFRRNWSQYLELIEEPWRTRFKQVNGPLTNHKTLVLRTQLISCEDYLNHLSRSRDYLKKKAELSSTKLKKLSRALPERFWMVEFTCPQIYAVNRAKFGEVLLKFNPSRQELRVFGTKNVSPIYLGLRFINHLALEEYPTDVTLGFKSHIGLFRRLKEAIEY